MKEEYRTYTADDGLLHCANCGGTLERRLPVPVLGTQWREAEPGVLFQESVRRGGKLHAEIAKNKSVRA